jgi:hypothetical protein
MALETATFNPQEFELRNITNPYVTPEQSEAIALTESRVNGQLDFLAQMLGWNGPNYWTNLPNTPDQKRQLLGGSFGVYNSFYLPRVYAVRNWDNSIVVDNIPFLKPGKRIFPERIVLGEQFYTITNLTVEGETYILEIGDIDQNFYDQVQNNVPIQILIPSIRPTPFYREKVGVSGDAAFLVASDGTELFLYPAYDTKQQFRYLSLALFGGSVYSFTQPVYIKFNLSSTTPGVSPTYDPNSGTWLLQVPENLVTSAAPITSFLCWDYSDATTPTTVSTPILIQQWADCSDWNSLSTLRYFTGAWGNKGGPLPFNLAFDSLSIHGVSEENALITPVIQQSVSYARLMEQVYSQLSAFDITAPSNPNPGDLWWNPVTGALSVWYDPRYEGCASWVEILYREQPQENIVASLVYPDVTAFVAAAPTIPAGITVLILDANGLSTAEQVVGLTGTITSNPSLYLYKDPTTGYWVTYQFTFGTVADFTADAQILPIKVTCIIDDAYGLSPVAVNYKIPNLDFQILQPVPVVVYKVYTNNTWNITPDSILKYISQSVLPGYENQGEMWWDYGNPVYETRAASIYIQSAWVSVNYHPLSAAPQYYFDQLALRFYADGVLLQTGVEYTTGEYVIKYTYNYSTETYDFVYTPITLLGETQLPKIEVSDSLEGTYREDITQLIFGGITYRLTPSVADSEVPLRLWKTQDLQDVGTLAHLAEDNYINPLVADQNNGPGQENWEKFFVRLPLDYERNGEQWQKVALICQDFAYYGSNIDPEKMRCPPEDDTPAIYEELFLYDQPIPDYTYVYCEPYLYSNIAYFTSPELGDYENAGFFPAYDLPFDGYEEAELVSYDPLHNRLADTTSPAGEGYGDWVGVYSNLNPCISLSGFFINDQLDGALEPVSAPIWDASIYKIPPTCENDPESYSVDANHYKIGYCYFVADASAAEDAFFDIQQISAWRYVQEPLRRNLYLTPRGG